MIAYQLLARLRHMALCQGNWDDDMFIGSYKMWDKVTREENRREAELKIIRF